MDVVGLVGCVSVNQPTLTGPTDGMFEPLANA